jgi:hypothetical protein
MPYFSASTIQSEILEYLSGHPESQDTLDAIAQWWLVEHQMRIVPQRLKLVLAELVRNGSLHERQTSRGCVYAVNQKPEQARKSK